MLLSNKFKITFRTVKSEIRMQDENLHRTQFWNQFTQIMETHPHTLLHKWLCLLHNNVTVQEIRHQYALRENRYVHVIYNTMYIVQTKICL